MFIYNAIDENREAVDKLIESYINNSFIMDINHMDLVNNIKEIQAGVTKEHSLDQRLLCRAQG